jgi:hypothetical protein
MPTATARPTLLSLLTAVMHAQTQHCEPMKRPFKRWILVSGVGDTTNTTLHGKTVVISRLMKYSTGLFSP